MYGLVGTLRAHLFGKTPITDVRVHGNLAYVFTPGRNGRVAIVDVEAGKVLRTLTRATLEILAR
jgi:hypothetical protein